jgi:RNA polymerase sigma factor (sigma-70 family)
MKTIPTQLLDSLAEFSAFARKRVGDPDLAADVVQDSLLKALKATGQIRTDESAKAWFYRILRHTIIDLYRRRDVQKRALEKLTRELHAPVGDAEENLACACLRRIVPTLTPQYAVAIQRLDLKGEAFDSVAADLGLTTANLSVRLHRARKQLKQRLTQTCRLCAKHGCLNCSCETVPERKG